jgi:hypothetical protein
MIASDCPLVNRWFGHCQYEPRYDFVLQGNIKMDVGTPEMVEATKNRIYVRDVCTRCGRWIERKP